MRSGRASTLVKSQLLLLLASYCPCTAFMSQSKRAHNPHISGALAAPSPYSLDLPLDGIQRVFGSGPLFAHHGPFSILVWEMLDHLQILIVAKVSRTSDATYDNPLSSSLLFNFELRLIESRLHTKTLLRLASLVSRLQNAAG